MSDMPRQVRPKSGTSSSHPRIVILIQHCIFLTLLPIIDILPEAYPVSNSTEVPLQAQSDEVNTGK